MFKIKQDFKWAHRNVDVVEYKAGDDLDTDDQELIDVATAEGWIEVPGEEKPAPKTKALKGAPENKGE